MLAKLCVESSKFFGLVSKTRATDLAGQRRSDSRSRGIHETGRPRGATTSDRANRLDPPGYR